MKETKHIDVKHLSWQSINCSPDGIMIEFKTGDKVSINWELARDIARQCKKDN